MRILPDPLSNYANSAERHQADLSLFAACGDRGSFDLNLAAPSCPSTTPINSSRSWTWPCQSAAPPHFAKWEKVCLALSKKSAELEEDESSFPGWVLAVCPSHLGLRRMRRKQPRTACENRNLHFSLRRMALLLAWVYHGQIAPCFSKWLLKHIFPHFSFVREQCGAARFLFHSQSQSHSQAEYKTWSSGLSENAD